MPSIAFVDCLPFMVPKRTSWATNLPLEASAWITTLSPTFKSLRVAAAPLFSNLVLSLTWTVTDFLAVVSTVTELSEMLSYRAHDMLFFSMGKSHQSKREQQSNDC